MNLINRIDAFLNEAVPLKRKPNTKIRIEKGIDKAEKKDLFDIRETDDYTIVKLHGTDIVKFNDNKIILNSGGWKTMTTKRRMHEVENEYNLGYSISNVRGNWVVTFKGKNIPFEDGMVLER